MGTPHDRYSTGTAQDAPAVRLTVRTAGHMHRLGLRLAGLLAPGDLVLLSGELGAGKTTLTRGLGEGLQVRGAVTSPTFVIARVHPSLVGGPALVHVDAYRLGGGLDEMEDLDLDVSLPESVVVVEWGEGKVEELSEARLQVVIGRTVGGTPPDAPNGSPAAGTSEDDFPGDGDGDASGGDGSGDDVRDVTITGIGPRWAQQDFSPLTAALVDERS